MPDGSTAELPEGRSCGKPATGREGVHGEGAGEAPLQPPLPPSNGDTRNELAVPAHMCTVGGREDHDHDSWPSVPQYWLSGMLHPELWSDRYFVRYAPSELLSSEDSRSRMVESPEDAESSVLPAVGTERAYLSVTVALSHTVSTGQAYLAN